MSLHRIARRMTAAVAASAAFALALSGCTTTAGVAGGSAEPLEKEDLVIVASVINTLNPYFQGNITGAEALGEELDIPVEIVDANGDPGTQISKIQGVIAKGKKVVLFVNTVDNSVVRPIVESVKQAGGFVTIWWNKPDDYEPWDAGDNFVAFQKHSGVDSGRCNAKALADSLGGEGNVIMLPGVQDSTTSQTRVAGFRAEMEENYPGITILEERPSNWDPQLAFDNSKQLITKYGDDINGVWSADDGMQIGSMKAFKDAGLIDQVKFASDGLYPETIAAMQAGEPIVGETFHRGYMASAVGLYTAYLAATGEIDPSELPKEKRNSLFELSCVTPDTLPDYLQYDEPDAPAKFIDGLIENGPWAAEPMPLVGGGPEVLP